ncbi:MAG: hypothetical protein BMS9Abin23_0819 [Thermodesulfobacteriota bacterium]|nr:MAG: hypothetical protein BMS9Abin23_0819 [Thermodesulfobacteriota bacterium]
MANQDEIVEKLLNEDEAFKKAYTSHSEFQKKVNALEKKPHLSAAETLEKKRLKKLKLAFKDEMEKIISQHRLGAS